MQLGGDAKNGRCEGMKESGGELPSIKTPYEFRLSRVKKRFTDFTPRIRTMLLFIAAG